MFFEYHKCLAMEIKRNKNEVLFKVSPDIGQQNIERIVDYIEYLELSSNKYTTQEQADQLAEELNENWWNKNKNKFLK